MSSIAIELQLTTNAITFNIVLFSELKTLTAVFYFIFLLVCAAVASSSLLSFCCLFVWCIFLLLQYATTQFIYTLKSSLFFISLYVFDFLHFFGSLFGRLASIFARRHEPRERARRVLYTCTHLKRFHTHFIIIV